MTKSGQKLSLAKNPTTITFHAYYLANRAASGPATVCIGSETEITDLATRLDGLVTAEHFWCLF